MDRIQRIFLIWSILTYCMIAASDECTGCPPPATMTCSCPTSFTVASDCPTPGTMTCTCPVCPGQTEVDACETNPCQNDGICILKPDGGFFCECTEDYTGERCETVVSTSMCEFFTTSRTGEGNFVNSTGHVTLTVDLLSDAAIRVVNDGNDRLFYTTANLQSVYVLDMSSDPVVEELVASFDGNTYGIAVDPQMEVVFTAVVGVGIQSMNYTGGDRTTVAAITVYYDNDGLALDTETKDLFFTAYTPNLLGKVNYQNLTDPGDVMTIKTGFPSKPIGLFTDKPAQRLYILLGDTVIWFMNLLDHTDLGPIVSAPSMETFGVALAVCGGYFYYTDHKTNTIWRISTSESDGDEREPFNVDSVGTLRGITLIYFDITVVDECESGPCQNGGTCISEVDGFNCQCTGNYTGERCESEVDACESSPCQNGGICTSAEIGGFICRCQEDYTGERCEADLTTEAPTSTSTEDPTTTTTVVSTCEFFTTSRTGEGNFLNSTGHVTHNVYLLDGAIRVVSDGNGRLFYTTANMKSVNVYDASSDPVVQQAFTGFSGNTYGIAIDTEFEVVFVAVVGVGIQAMDYADMDRSTVAAITVTYDNDGLALDSDTKDLFFTAYTQNLLGKVNYQNPANPGDVITVHTGFPTGPIGLFTDKPTQRLYILLGDTAIWSMNLLDHTDLGAVVSAPTAQSNGVALSVCGGDFYYTDHASNTIWRISTSESDGDEREPFNVDDVGTLRGIILVDLSTFEDPPMPSPLI